LSNATTFTLKDGRVTLTALATNDILKFEIRGAGLGVPKDKILDLTGPFIRVDSDPYKSKEDTGLGLAIVKSFVEFYEGALVTECEIGVGTVVTVTRPMAGPSTSQGHQ
jgi:signal transduction histidine kinase